MKQVFKVTMLVNVTINTIENGINKVRTEAHYIKGYYGDTQYDAVMKATCQCNDHSYVDYKLFGLTRNGLVLKSEAVKVVEVIEVDPRDIITTK